MSHPPVYVSFFWDDSRVRHVGYFVPGVNSKRRTVPQADIGLSFQWEEQLLGEVLYAPPPAQYAEPSPGRDKPPTLHLNSCLLESYVLHCRTSWPPFSTFVLCKGDIFAGARSNVHTCALSQDH